MKMRLAAATLMVSLITPVFADEAKQALANELLECTAYYQIASEALASLNAPQMAAVGEKLKLSATQAQALAGQYMPVQALPDALAQVRQKQILTMKDAKDLAGLMATYKDKCRQVMADPEARLDYWVMATM